MSLAFGRFCADLGLPLRSAYSWCAINREKQQAIFTVWDDEIDHDKNEYEFWNDEVDNARLSNPDRRKTRNLEEMRQILLEAMDNGYQTLGIRCTPRYPLTSPRSRESYVENELLVVHLRHTPTGITGRFQGKVASNSIRRTESLAQTMGLSAIDDLDGDPPGNATPDRWAFSGTFFVRDSKVRDKVIKRAKGKCEYCGSLGFKKYGGAYYLEAHHIISLAKQGPDTLENVIALCPNHHREAHFGEGSQELEAKFKTILAKLRGN
ncbi:HNH endonuclease [Sphingorhabdus sp.]|uniref:HNH endonuclease n=1 Tax=Sphingorhabdus sp. TaxID=1902408 RepID=UPI0037C7DD23